MMGLYRKRVCDGLRWALERFHEELDHNQDKNAIDFWRDEVERYAHILDLYERYEAKCRQVARVP